MEKWSKEELEQVLAKRDGNRLRRLHEQIRRSSWRARYHIQTVTGLMNDPNGFSFYGNRWHLFYQWFPFGAVHGMKHWYHVSSTDLVHWKNEGLALKPDTVYDNKGCYSGSAFVKDGHLFLVYTGNHNEADGRRIPYQMLAAMDEEGHIQKLSRPIIKPENGYTEHQRDPKIFTENGYYYILLGAQDNEKRGKMLLYRSDQLADGWKLMGELKVKGYDSFGYMVECPDIEKIGNKYLLLFSPQGLHGKGDEFRNAYQNVYMIGDFDAENLIFTPDERYKELDRGLDFYAAQCANQNVYTDKTVLEGWFGVSDYSYPPTDEEGWANLLTLPRELSIENGKLMQRPAAALSSLKGKLLFEAADGKIKEDHMYGRTPDSAVIELNNPTGGSVSLELFSTGLHKGFSISYNHDRGYFTIDRSDMENQVNTEYGSSRRIRLENGLKSMTVYVDRSSVEVFINNGEYVMSSRIFPTVREHLLRMSGKGINMKIYNIDLAVSDDDALFPSWMESVKK
jgi:beta-fructofuranosidase